MRSANNAQQRSGTVHAPPKHDAEPRSSPEQRCQEAMGGKWHGLLCSHGKLPPAGRCTTARAGAAALMVLGCCCACGFLHGLSQQRGSLSGRAVLLAQPMQRWREMLAALPRVCTSADTAMGRSAGLGAAVFAKGIRSLPTSLAARGALQRLTRSCSFFSTASSPMVSSQLPNPSFPYEKKCKTEGLRCNLRKESLRLVGGRRSSAGHCSQPPLSQEGTVLAEMLQHCPFPRHTALLGCGGWDNKS